MTPTQCAGKPAVDGLSLVRPLRHYAMLELSSVTFVSRYNNFIDVMAFAFASIAACSTGARGSRLGLSVGGLFS